MSKKKYTSISVSINNKKKLDKIQQAIKNKREKFCRMDVIIEILINKYNGS